MQGILGEFNVTVGGPNGLGRAAPRVLLETGGRGKSPPRGALCHSVIYNTNLVENGTPPKDV